MQKFQASLRVTSDASWSSAASRSNQIGAVRTAVLNCPLRPASTTIRVAKAPPVASAVAATR
jgi:hypothetical protein